MAQDERTNPRKTFAKALKTFRQAKSPPLSQAVLADELGRSQQWVAKLESAAQPVTLEDAYAIANALDVDLRALLGLGDDELADVAVKTVAEKRARLRDLRASYEEAKRDVETFADNLLLAREETARRENLYQRALETMLSLETRLAEATATLGTGTAHNATVVVTNNISTGRKPRRGKH